MQAAVVVCDASPDGDRVCVALRSAGHRVLEASPRQLLSCVAEANARFVVIDADGEASFAAFRALRDDPKLSGVDVLLVSETRVLDRSAAMDLGASGLFGRPVDDAQVVRKVNALREGASSGEFAAALPARPSPHPPQRSVSHLADLEADGVKSILTPLPAELLLLLAEPIGDDGLPEEGDERKGSGRTPSAENRDPRSLAPPPFASRSERPKAQMPLRTFSIHESETTAQHRLGAAIGGRESGHFVVRADTSEWAFVVREGDLICVSSTDAPHSFFSFLTVRGVIARSSRASLLEQPSHFGPRAATAAVALGILQAIEVQDFLASHADWLLAIFVASNQLRESSWLPLDSDALDLYATDMVPFAAREGASTWVESHRRAIEPEHAFDALRGDFVLARGEQDRLLALLTPEEEAVLLPLLEKPVGALPHEPRSIRAVAIALERLGAVRFVPRLPTASVATPEPLAVMRARIAVRSELVKEGDYFALLGVGASASGHEIRRAYLELRRTLEPARLPYELESLAGDAATIVELLDEAYEVLRDNGRRERYRRAITPTPFE